MAALEQQRRRTRSGAYVWLARLHAFRRDSLASAAVGSAFMLVVVTALGSLWRAAAGDRVLSGYDATMLVWYVAMAEVAVTSVQSQYLVELSDRIRRGGLASLMTRPVAPAWWFVAEEVGASLMRGVFLLIPASVVALALVGVPDRPERLLTVVVTLPLAICLQVILNTALSAATFWLSEARAVWFLHQKIVFLAGGMLIPAELCPEPLATIFPFLPWAGIAYTPGRAAVAAGGLELVGLVALQLAWIGAASVLMTTVFRRGEQRMAVGGG